MTSGAVRQHFLTGLRHTQVRLELGIASKFRTGSEGGSLASSNNPLKSLDSSEVEAGAIILDSGGPFAKGSFGEVYACHLAAAALGRLGMPSDFSASLACKVIALSMADDEELSRACRELVLLYEFGLSAFHRRSSYFIAWALDDGQGSSSPRLLLVMRRAEGSLWDMACQGAWRSPCSLLPVFFRVCEALAHVHASGAVHHDLHAGNVLLYRDDKGGLLAVLIDFGLDSLVLHESITPPEVAVAEAAGASEEEVTRALRDPASDIYRLGLMIQAVLTKLSEGPDQPAPHGSTLLDETDCIDALVVIESYTESEEEEGGAPPVITRVLPDMPRALFEEILAAPLPLSALLGTLARLCTVSEANQRPTAAQVRDVLRAACYASPAEPAHATRERMAAGQVVLVLEPAFNADSQETP